MHNVLNNYPKPAFCQTDVKCRFFAQYWGQKVLCFKDKGYSTYPINSPNMFGKGSTNQLDIAFLKLKHLSKITDDEARQLPNREYDDFSKNYDSSKQFLNLFKLMGFLTLEEGDVLRKLSFLIPFENNSIDDLISFDWVRCS